MLTMCLNKIISYLIFLYHGGVEATTFYILSEESKSLYEAYKKQYVSNPFDSTTLETGNKLIS